MPALDRVSAAGLAAVPVKVLVAEDDSHIRDGLVEILEGEGYRTVAAADGADALVAFGAERPDFVLLDIMMPVLDGYEGCRRIRKADGAVPIIFISAKSEEVDRVLGLDLGADLRSLTCATWTPGPDLDPVGSSGVLQDYLIILIA